MNRNKLSRQPLRREDITDDLVIIKINQLFREGMSDLELYEITRGIWKRRIDSVNKAKYALAVYKGAVVEVYRIIQWMEAGTVPMKTRIIDPERYKGRIEFIGEIAADDVRCRYIDKDVSGLFRYGEANPVKTFYL